MGCHSPGSLERNDRELCSACKCSQLGRHLVRVCYWSHSDLPDDHLGSRLCRHGFPVSGRNVAITRFGQIQCQYPLQWYCTLVLSYGAPSRFHLFWRRYHRRVKASIRSLAPVLLARRSSRGCSSLGRDPMESQSISNWVSCSVCSRPPVAGRLYVFASF